MNKELLVFLKKLDNICKIPDISCLTACIFPCSLLVDSTDKKVRLVTCFLPRFPPFPNSVPCYLYIALAWVIFEMSIRLNMKIMFRKTVLVLEFLYSALYFSAFEPFRVTVLKGQKSLRK